VVYDVKMAMLEEECSFEGVARLTLDLAIMMSTTQGGRSALVVWCHLAMETSGHSQGICFLMCFITNMMLPLKSRDIFISRIEECEVMK